MEVTNQIHQEILNWISNEGDFKQLTLTPNGELFINPDRTVKADDFWVYNKPAVYWGGSLYTNRDGDFHSFGEDLTRDRSFMLMKNRTEIRLLKHGDVQLFSKNAGSPIGSTLIAFFRYRTKAVAIFAGDAFKRRSDTLIVEATEENTALLFKEFSEILGKCDPKMAANLAASQDPTAGTHNDMNPN